jgi:hypothetical protein
MAKIRVHSLIALTLILAASAFVQVLLAVQSVGLWWSPGSGAPLAATAAYENPYGRLSILNTAGPIDTKGHSFFEPIGSNGRACVTCHQPADAMSISAETIQERWRATNGKDPLFAAIDGKNCPDLPAGDPKSHSLLLNRGLIRVMLPWPPKAAAGSAVTPEFTIEVVRDPAGCNTSSVYGLNSPDSAISVYRRPRPVANLKYVTADNFGVGRFIGKNGQPTARDPETGRLVQMNMMADARELSLKTQARSAASDHLQVTQPLSAAQIEQILAFETQIYAAQTHHNEAGDLTEPGGPPAFGPGHPRKILPPAHRSQHLRR